MAIDAIDAAFNPPSSKLPKWAVRMLLSYAIGLIAVLIIRPKSTLDLKYEPKNNVCSWTTDKSKVLVWSLFAAGIAYLGVRKYY